MSDLKGYVVWDDNRKRYALEFRAFSDEKAVMEFCSWYNRLVRPSRWSERKFGRYFLLWQSRIVRGMPEFLEKPVILMEDDEVRLSYELFRLSDPPATDAEQEALDRDFEALDAVDRERLARRGNRAA